MTDARGRRGRRPLTGATRSRASTSRYADPPGEAEGGRTGLSRHIPRRRRPDAQGLVRAVLGRGHGVIAPGRRRPRRPGGAGRRAKLSGPGSSAPLCRGTPCGWPSRGREGAVSAYMLSRPGQAVRHNVIGRIISQKAAEKKVVRRPTIHHAVFFLFNSCRKIPYSAFFRTWPVA